MKMRWLLMKAAKKVARQLALSKQTACSVRLSSRRTNYLFVTSGHLLPTIQRLFVSLVIIGNPVEKEADPGVFFCCRKHAYISHTWWSHTHTHTPALFSIAMLPLSSSAKLLHLPLRESCSLQWSLVGACAFEGCVWILHEWKCFK